MQRVRFCVVAALAAVLAGGEPIFIHRTPQDPEDQVIRGYKDFRVDVKTGHFMYKAVPGGHITGIWKSQQLSIECGKIEGNWTGNQQTGMTMESATMTGGVNATTKRPSQAVGSSQPQITTITGSSATFTNVGYALHVIGGVHLTNEDPGAQQSLDATGSTADLELTRPHTTGRGVRAATFEGPVHFEMHGNRTDTSASAPKRLPFVLSGSSDRMLYNDAARTVTLVGHVHITGDDPGLGGDQDVDRETIHLNPDGSVDTVEGEGSPGVTRFHPKTLSGGGGK